MAQTLKRVSQLSTNLHSILQLTWHAHPRALICVIALNTLQGLLPLATAWITKLLFDLLAQRLSGETTFVWTSLLWLVVVQAVLLLVGQLITPLATYLKAKLNRQLTRKIQVNIYQKINNFSGIALFENPQLHDTIRLANQGARHGSEQTLWLLTSLIQSGVVLASFITVLLAFSPLLAGLVVLAALPQLAMQLKLGRQRVQLMYDLTSDERRKFYYDFLLSHEKAAKEMRLLDVETYFIDKVNQLYNGIHRAERHQQQRELRWETGLGTLSSLVTSGAFLAVVVAAFNGSLTLGDVTLYISAVRSVQEALKGIFFAVSGLHKSSQFYTYYLDLLAMTEPLTLMFANGKSPIDLSGGQWQKIAMARLFMRQEANLLILDEPTAALDAQAEHDLFAQFVELANGRTTLLISHRFSTVKMADCIAVLDDGRIVEHGSHEELLALGGKYAKLYTMQAEKYR